MFLVADTRLYTLLCRSHYRSCPTVRYWIAVYPALFCSTVHFYTICIQVFDCSFLCHGYFIPTLTPLNRLTRSTTLCSSRLAFLSPLETHPKNAGKKQSFRRWCQLHVFLTALSRYLLHPFFLFKWSLCTQSFFLSPTHWNSVTWLFSTIYAQLHKVHKDGGCVFWI